MVRRTSSLGALYSGLTMVTGSAQGPHPSSRARFPRLCERLPLALPRRRCAYVHPSAAHLTSPVTTEQSAKRLSAAGFSRLHETDPWHLKRGGKYYITRNESTIFAFSVGGKFVRVDSSLPPQHSLIKLRRRPAPAASASSARTPTARASRYLYHDWSCWGIR